LVVEISIILFRSYNQLFNMAAAEDLAIHLQILLINLFGAAAVVVGSTQPEALAGLLLLEALEALEAQLARRAPNPQAAVVGLHPAILALAAQARSS